jgi:hypothetical protein
MLEGLSSMVVTTGSLQPPTAAAKTMAAFCTGLLTARLPVSVGIADNRAKLESEIRPFTHWSGSVAR